jgi:hypothetical protein
MFAQELVSNFCKAVIALLPLLLLVFARTDQLSTHQQAGAPFGSLLLVDNEIMYRPRCSLHRKSSKPKRSKLVSLALIDKVKS